MIRGLLAAAMALLSTAVSAAPSVTVAPFGTGQDGQVVQVVTLKNDRGMIVRFSTRGGTIMEISAPDRRGRGANLVLGKPDFAAWDRGGSYNSVVGRYANRIGGGGFTLDGKRYDLPGANKETGVAIHGGPAGFAGKVWRAEPFQRAGEAGAVMTYVSPDGESGYPGELTVRMTYTLTDRNTLRLSYEATTTAPTVLNLTNHTYFNLGGASSGPIYGHRLTLAASHYTPSDQYQVPTGEIASVAGTPFDFRNGAMIADRVYSTHPQMMIARGIDHNFVIDGAGLRSAARLEDPISGRVMEVRTSEPGVQVYTANHFNGAQLGADGRTIRQGDGIAFETQHFPDSPNKPNFPTTVLRPGETFRSTTEFTFSVDRRPKP